MVESNKNAYNDAAIDEYLKKLQNKSLEELAAALERTAAQYKEATASYNEYKTNIRWERRRYWMFIFLGVFQEFWRVLIQGKQTKISEIKERKSGLEQTHGGQEKTYNESKELINSSMRKIQSDAAKVTEKINIRDAKIQELNSINETVETQDNKISELIEEEDKLANEQILNISIAERERLNTEIIGLNDEINTLGESTEGVLKSLVGLLDNFEPEYLPKGLLTNYRRENHEQTEALKERCKDVQHLAIKKLLNFLSRRTPSSLRALQEELAKDQSIFKDKELGDIVWEANKIYPAILSGKGDKLPSIKEIQQEEFRKVAERLQKLGILLDNLTDKRVILAKEINELTEKSKALAQEYHDITGEIIDKSYLSREKLKAIRENAEDHSKYKQVVEDYKTNKSTLLNKNKELSELNAVIREKEEEKELCIIKPVPFTPKILQKLIEKCEQEKSFFGTVHPVINSLICFLNYPTPFLLEKLHKTMQDNQNYKTNPKISTLLNETNRYFPYINSESHTMKFEFGIFKPSDNNQDPTTEENQDTPTGPRI